MRKNHLFLLSVFSFLFFILSSGYAASNPPNLPLVPNAFGKEGKGGEKIALFPFDNFTEDKDALTSVMPVLRGRLEARGFDVLDDDSLNRFLLKERIRFTGYIPKDIAGKLREELNVKAILVGSVNSFSPGENPQFGISARLIDSTNDIILWADHASATGEDFVTMLGLGKIKTIDKLVSKVIDKLLSSFTTAPPSKEIESTYRIAVMPFQNKSKTKDAGMIATYMFIAELFKNKKFEPVEYGEVRRMVVDLRVRGKGELDIKNIEAMSKSLGVNGVLVGTVELYTEAQGTLPPEAAISARLIDARKDRILWYDSEELNGDEGIFMLDFGKIRSAENVAYKVVSKLVKDMGKAKWQ